LCVDMVMTQMVVITPCLRNRWRYQIPPLNGKGFPIRGVSTGLVRCATAPPPHGAPREGAAGAMAGDAKYDPARKEVMPEPAGARNSVHIMLLMLAHRILCLVRFAPSGSAVRPLPKGNVVLTR
jgi:hypothetical protein